MASVIRYDTQTTAIVSINIVDTQDYQAQSIVAINNNEVFYSFKPSGSIVHHVVKASFDLADSTTIWLNETYHKTIAGDSTHGSISRLSHDNLTLWHAVNLDNYISYFQLNLTNNSIIGSGYNQTDAITNSGLSMDVSQEIV